MTVLRVYDPSDCDERGVPLDWERCRLCRGSGAGRQRVEEVVPGQLRAVRVPDGAPGSDEVCGRCGGHGSLKAAALAEKLRGTFAWSGIGSAVDVEDRAGRCEGCGHPMSDGTWEGDWTRMLAGDSPLGPREGPRGPYLGFMGDEPTDEDWQRVHMQAALAWLRAGREPEDMAVHYSPCDEGCRHGGPKRVLDPRLGKGWIDRDDTLSPIGVVGRRMLNDGTAHVEASWRAVDVRTLGWPHDLRPERLACLCLRCYAARSRADEPQRHLP